MRLLLISFKYYILNPYSPVLLSYSFMPQEMILCSWHFNFTMWETPGADSLRCPVGCINPRHKVAPFYFFGAQGTVWCKWALMIANDMQLRTACVHSVKMCVDFDKRVNYEKVSWPGEGHNVCMIIMYFQWCITVKLIDLTRDKNAKIQINNQGK